MGDHRQLSEGAAGMAAALRDSGVKTGAAFSGAAAWLRRRAARGYGRGGAMFIPAAFSAFWAVVILAYGFGYLATGEGRPVTVVEVLFFVALLGGPIAMVWIGAWMLARAERLAEATREQAGAARELARSVAQMRKVYDGAADEIGGRLGDHLIQLEERIVATTGALADMVDALTGEARDVLNARSQEIGRALGRNAETVAGTLEAQTRALTEALEDTTGALRTTLNGRAEEMRSILGTRTKDIDRALANGAERLERKLNETAARVERGLGAVADRAEATLGERSDGIAASFAATEAGIRSALDSRVTELDTILGRTAGTLSEVLDGRTGKVEEVLARIESSIETTLAGRGAVMRRDLDALSEAVAQIVVTRGEEIDQALSAQAETVSSLVGELTRRVEDASGGLNAALTANTGELREKVAGAIEEMRGSLSATSEEIRGALSGAGERMTTHLEARVSAIDDALAHANDQLRRGVGGEVKRLEMELTQLRSELAANPPASAAELSRMLGEVAAGMVAPEREALTGLVDRLQRVEGQVKRLIYAAERAARLAPLTVGAGREIETEPRRAETGEGGGVVLPFAEDLAGTEAPPPGWDVVLRALNFPDDGEDREGHRAMRRARSDPQLDRLIALAERLLAELAEEGVFMDDLTPNHAAASDWAGYAADPEARGVPALGGIADEVALAIGRGRLAGDAGLREAAMRLVQEWHRLVGRAVASAGEDGLLVELADTRTGRAVMLMGRITGAFPIPRAAAE